MVAIVIPVSVGTAASAAQSVDYGRLTSLLIEATREQRALIREQQKQIRMQPVLHP